MSKEAVEAVVLSALAVGGGEGRGGIKEDQTRDTCTFIVGTNPLGVIHFTKWAAAVT